jgi:hypothetical protein
MFSIILKRQVYLIRAISSIFSRAVVFICSAATSTLEEDKDSKKYDEDLTGILT